MENSLELLVKVAGQRELNDLIDKIKAGTASIDDMARASKLATGIYKSWGAENDKLKAGLAQTIVTIRNMKDEAMTPLASANAQMMHSYFKTGEQIRRTQGAFISMNQILQDAPFGIRGVGNNLQMLTQQFVTLRGAGMSTGQILRGIMQNVFTPMGLLMTAVSVGTSALTVAMDYLFRDTKKANEEVEDLTMSLAELNVELGYISEDQYLEYLDSRIKALSEEADKGLEPTSTYFEQLKSQLVGLYMTEPFFRGLNNTLYAFFNGVAMAKRGWASLFTFVATGSLGKPTTLIGTFDEEEFKKAEELEKKQLELEAKRKSRIDARKKREERAAKGDKMNMTPDEQAIWSQDFLREWEEGQKKSEEQSKKFAQDKAKYMIDLDERTQSAITDIQEAEWARREHIAQVVFQNEQDRLQTMANVYNAFFFDPLRAGFADLQQQVFGAENHVKALEQTFGRTGAAIVRALEGVIMKMAETAMFAALMNWLLPGSGTFTQNFMRMSGLAPTGGGGTTGRTTGAGKRMSEFASASTDATSIGIATAARARQNSRQMIQVSGVFRQQGSDLVAVVENTQLRRATRSMNVGR